MRDELTIINGEISFLCEKLSQVEGFEFPTTRNVYIDPPTRGGTLYINSLPGRRLLSWMGLIREDVPVNRRLLQQVCQIGNLKTIQFSTCDGLELQTEIEIDSFQMPPRPGTAMYQIQATAPSYELFSQALHSQTTIITVVNGGTPIPAAIPAPIGGGSSLTFILTNAGNTLTYPVLEIRGPGENFLVTNVDTGVSFELNLTLSENETVIIDTKNHTALLGTQNVFGSLVRNPTGQWFYLRAGTNRVTFNAQLDSNQNTRLKVSWRDAYLGV